MSKSEYQKCIEREWRDCSIITHAAFLASTGVIIGAAIGGGMVADSLGGDGVGLVGGVISAAAATLLTDHTLMRWAERACTPTSRKSSNKKDLGL